MKRSKSRRVEGFERVERVAGIALHEPTELVERALTLQPKRKHKALMQRRTSV